jgi:septal ring factor EnvC (AmiA/AmiB activator)
MATNIIATVAVAAAAGINWTILIALFAVCLTAMATLIKLYGHKSKISDENLRNSPYLQEIGSDLKAKEDKFNQLKELVNIYNIEVEKLKIESKNNSRSLEELKQDNRDLVQRLDDLLKQFMEYMEG